MHREHSVRVISMELGNKEPRTIDDKDPMTLVQFLLLIALGVVLALICIWIGPVLGAVLSLGTAGIVLVLVRRFRPRWIKAFWTWCIDVGQNFRPRP